VEAEIRTIEVGELADRVAPRANPIEEIGNARNRPFGSCDSRKSMKR